MAMTAPLPKNVEMTFEGFQFRFFPPGVSIPHWSGGISPDIDSKLDQATQPNSERYQPSSPCPM